MDEINCYGPAWLNSIPAKSCAYICKPKSKMLTFIAPVYTHCCYCPHHHNQMPTGFWLHIRQHIILSTYQYLFKVHNVRKSVSFNLKCTAQSQCYFFIQSKAFSNISIGLLILRLGAFYWHIIIVLSTEWNIAADCDRDHYSTCLHE